MKITEFVKKPYLSYFGIKLGDQDKPWASHLARRFGVEHLREWTNGKRKTELTFGVPMDWREPTNHVDDCYFCMVHLTGVSSRTICKVEYPNIPSAIRPIPYSADLPVPSFHSFKYVSNSEASSESSTELDNDDNFVGCSQDRQNPDSPPLSRKKIFCFRKILFFFFFYGFPKR